MNHAFRATWAVSRPTIVIASLAFALLAPKPGWAQLGTLAEPFPAPANNAALHYQRALLQLAKLDRSQLAPLDQPVWQLLADRSSDSMPAEATSLLGKGHLAIASATTGSRTADCNFGIDFSQFGAAAQLPHVESMVQLGRLMTLRGVFAEAKGDWEEALIIYFDGLRIGRHMAQQPTLLEALAGVEILRNNYDALAHWATRCPARLLVARAFGLLEAIQHSLVDPSRVITSEASILATEFEQLRQAHPQGRWAEMILASYAIPVTGNAADDKAAAIAACVERGVPREVFDSEKKFAGYLRELESTGNRYVESVAACMALPPMARVVRARAISKKYHVVLPILYSDTTLDPVEIGVLFAQHEAELSLLRISLAICASQKDDAFPDSLDAVASRFGGQVPTDPYSGESVSYTVGDEGQSFMIEVPSRGLLVGVRFQSQRAAPAGQQ